MAGKTTNSNRVRKRLRLAAVLFMGVFMGVVFGFWLRMAQLDKLNGVRTGMSYPDVITRMGEPKFTFGTNPFKGEEGFTCYWTPSNHRIVEVKFDASGVVTGVLINDTPNSSCLDVFWDGIASVP